MSATKETHSGPEDKGTSGLHHQAAPVLPVLLQEPAVYACPAEPEELPCAQPPEHQNINTNASNATTVFESSISTVLNDCPVSPSLVALLAPFVFFMFRVFCVFIFAWGNNRVSSGCSECSHAFSCREQCKAKEQARLEGLTCLSCFALFFGLPCGAATGCTLIHALYMQQYALTQSPSWLALLQWHMTEINR